MPDKQEILILTAVFFSALGLIPVFYIARPRRKLLLPADAGGQPASIPVSPVLPEIPVLREAEMPLGTDGVYQPPRTDIPVPPPVPAHARENWFDWRDAMVALICMGVFSLFMGPVGQLLVLLAPQAGGGAQTLPAMTPRAGLVAANCAFQFLLVGALLFYLAKIRRLPVVAMFGFRHGTPLQILLRALAGLGFCIIALFAGAALSYAVKSLLGRDFEPQPIVKLLTETDDMVFISLVVFTAAIGAPLLEELFFRGFFFGVSRQYLGVTGAVIITSMLFGVVHTNLLSLIPLTLLGAVFAVAYHKSRNLLVPMLIHAFFNGGQMALMLSGVALPEQN